MKSSTIKVGGILLKEIDNNYLKFDLTVNLTWSQSKFAVILEFAASYYSAIESWEDIVPCFVRAELTPYMLTPKVGISLLTVLELDLGYRFSIQHKKNYQPIEGFVGSLRFNIPLNLFD